MAYTGVITNCLNALSDALVAAATALSITVDRANIVQAMAPMQPPNVVVCLPTIPFEQIVWGGTGNLKNDDFTAEVWINTQIQQEAVTAGGHPYGDATTPGLLTITSQVEDAIENAYATLLAADTRIVDVQLLNTMYTRKTDASVVSAVVRVKFTLRYFAGNRG